MTARLDMTGTVLPSDTVHIQQKWAVIVERYKSGKTKRSVHGPFASQELAFAWCETLPDDKVCMDYFVHELKSPQTRG